MTAEAPKQLGFKEVMADPRLRRLCTSQFVSMFGDFLAIYAILSVVSFRMQAGAGEVAGVLIAYILPMAVVSPLAGVFADRWNVRTTMIVSDLLRAVLVLALLYSTAVWHIYAVLIALSAISSFFMPSQTIAIRSIVPKEGLMAANGIMMQIMQVTQIASPALAGVLIKLVGENSCFWLDSVSFLASASIVASFTIQRAGAPPKNAASIVTDLTAGVRYIFTHSTLAFTVVSMAAGLFAIRCYSALIAVYVRDILHLAQGWFGALGTLVGVGMIAGTQVVNKLAKTRSMAHVMMGGLAGIAVGVLGIALVSNVILASIATFEIGVSVALVVISAQTLMQGQTPIEMLGRVSSSLMSVMALAQVAGLALSGSVAQIVGIRNAYVLTSVLLAGISLTGFAVLKKRRASA